MATALHPSTAPLATVLLQDVLRRLAPLVDLRSAGFIAYRSDQRSNLIHAEAPCRLSANHATQMAFPCTLADLLVPEVTLCACVDLSNAAWGALGRFDPLPDLVMDDPSGNTHTDRLFAAAALARLAPGEGVHTSSVLWALEVLDSFVTRSTPPDFGALFVVARGAHIDLPREVAWLLPDAVWHDPRGSSLLLLDVTSPESFAALSPAVSLVHPHVSRTRVLELIPLFSELFRSGDGGFEPSDAYLASQLLLD